MILGFCHGAFRLQFGRMATSLFLGLKGVI